MRLLFVALTAVMVLSLCAAMLSPALAVKGSYPGRNGKIVFHAGPCPDCVPPFQYLNYVMNPDGTDLNQFTPPPWTYDPNTPIPPANYPVWSPDGSKIAFSYEPWVNNVWVMNADGSNWIQLTPYAGGVMDTGEAAWSPDGSKIAFTTYGTTINVMPAVPGATPTVLTLGGSPHWSPDASKILFHRWNDGVYVMNADGSDEKKLISDALDPCWSPDSSKVVFSSGAGIWVMSAADGTVLAKLTGNKDDIQPSWSPDGGKIAFARGDRVFGPGSIWVMNADGSNPINLTPNMEAPAHDPDWQRLPAAGPIGGTVASADKIAIIASYLALCGLVATVTIVIAAPWKKPDTN